MSLSSAFIYIMMGWFKFAFVVLALCIPLYLLYDWIFPRMKL
jgi:hypothetical protein